MATRTLNNRGSMHKLSEVGQAFVDFAASATAPVIDMGAAFGVATLAAVARGATVIACDLEPSHLKGLYGRLRPEQRKNVVLQAGYFPTDFDFDENSIAAVYCSFLMNFLSPHEMDEALGKINAWLVPGGKLFACNYSGYLGVYSSTLFDDMDRDRGAGVRWPGWIEVKRYSDNRYLLEHFPGKMHMLTAEVLAAALRERHFDVERADYLDCRDGRIPPYICRDGREWSRVIAAKR